MTIEPGMEQYQALGDCTTEDAFQAQIESAAAAGWDDPVLDICNELDPRRPMRSFTSSKESKGGHE